MTLVSCKPVVVILDHFVCTVLHNEEQPAPDWLRETTLLTHTHFTLLYIRQSNEKKHILTLLKIDRRKARFIQSSYQTFMEANWTKQEKTQSDGEWVGMTFRVFSTYFTHHTKHCRHTWREQTGTLARHIGLLTRLLINITTQNSETKTESLLQSPRTRNMEVSLELFWLSLKCVL